MKTMTKSIVLKMLTGVTTTVLTVAGVAVPITIGSNQNTADVSVIADEDIQTVEMIVDTKITSDETGIVEEADTAEESMTKPEYIDNDEQSTDVVVTNIQSDNVVVVVDDVQKSYDEKANDDDDGMIVATAESTVVGIIEGTGNTTDEQPVVPAEPLDPVDSVVPVEPEVTEEEHEDCVVGHRYCVGGATFNFYKNSGLNEDAWMAHVREHVAKSELVRWTDK